MAAPRSNTSATAGTPKPSGRYDASGMRVLSNKDRDKVRALGKKAKAFRGRVAKSARLGAPLQRQQRCGAAW